MTPAIAVDIPVIIKSRTEGTKRLVEVEASNEATDGEGDVIVQAGLLAAAPQFIARGHLDLDHFSEIGSQIGISNPTAYIVGRPTEVKDLGKGRTSVVGEIMKSLDGSHDPENRKYDSFWDSLQTDPPAPWRASIYGYPQEGQVLDTRLQKCADYPTATRFVVKGINWTSLAFTLTPMNDAITGHARVISAKALMKAYTTIGGAPVAKYAGDIGVDSVSPAPLPMEPYFMPPRNRVELLGHYYALMEKGLSPYAGGPGGRSVWQFREHFENMCALPYWDADLLANALAHLIKRENRA